MARRAAFNRVFARAWLALGFAFLYVPIVALVVYSFNDSPVANVWRGFTLRWYAALADDRELLAGLALSLKVAFATACASVVLGTLAAFALVRYRRFFGRTLFAGMVAAPLVMPEVIIGLSLLLMLVSLQRATEAGVRRRLSRARHADDLARPPAARHGLRDGRGSRPPADAQPAARGGRASTSARGPWQVFWLVTLPMIGQALLSAFLLTFTLSLDDVVLSAFLSGPGATTMPLVIFSRARLGLNPSVNAVATIIITLVAIGVVVASFVLARNERRRALDAAAANGRGRERRAVARLARLPLPRGGDGDRRRLRRLLEGAGHRLPGLPARRLRFAIAAVAMAPWLRRRCRRGRRSTRAAIGCCSSSRSSATSCSRSACSSGIRHSSALAAGVIMAALPGGRRAALLAAARRARRAGASMLGIACAIAGIALVALRARRRGRARERLARSAALLLLGAVTCEALYVVIGKKLSASVGPKRISALINLWGLALVDAARALAAARLRAGRSFPSRRGCCSSSTRSPPASSRSGSG